MDVGQSIAGRRARGGRRRRLLGASNRASRSGGGHRRRTQLYSIAVLLESECDSPTGRPELALLLSHCPTLFRQLAFALPEAGRKGERAKGQGNTTLTVIEEGLQ
jgi:uncharacterized protein (DUF2336 family)